MPARGRRSRIAFVGVLVFLAFLFYQRSSVKPDKYTDVFSQNAGVGGGAVIRPSLDDIPPQRPRPDPASGQLAADTELEEEKQKVVQENQAPPPNKRPEEKEIAPETSSTPETSSSIAPATTPPAAQAGKLDESEILEADGLAKGRLAESEQAHLTSTSSVPHWTKLPEHFPITSTIPLPKRTSIPFHKIQRAEKKLAQNGADKEKLAVIKEEVEFTWKGYREFAFGQDEVKPVSGKVNNPFNNWGATLVDSLDALWIMNMTKEFDEAVEKVAEIDFTTSPRRDIPLFETTIRYLGGLVGAYDVAGRDKKYRVLLDKAHELAEILYAAFDTPNRMPLTRYNWRPSYASQPHRANSRSVMSELGSLSMEFTRFAQLTGEPKYYDAIARITDEFELLQNHTRLPGLWPTYIDATGCERTSQQSKLTKVSSNQMPLPGGDGMMEAGEAVQQKGSSGKTSQSRLEGDRSSDHSDAKDLSANHQAGLSKIKAWGDPIEEGMLDSKKAKADVLGDSATREDKVMNQQGGVKKIKGWGDPIDEISGKPKSQQEAARVNDLGASKVKRLHEEQEDSHLALERDLTPSVDNQSSERHLDKRRPPGVPEPTMEIPDEKCTPQGLKGSPSSAQEIYTLAGLADSTYEYLPKEYLLLGGQVDQYKTMYLASAEVAIEKLIYKPMTIDKRDILMAGELKLTPNNSEPVETRTWNEYLRPELAHLTCFAGGMFAMGGVIFDKPEHVEIGSKLTEGCVWAYSSMASGIMPDTAQMMTCPETWGDCEFNKTAYWQALDPQWETRLPEDMAIQELDGDAEMAKKGSEPVSKKTSGSVSGGETKSDLKKEKDGSSSSRSGRVDKRSPTPDKTSPLAGDPPLPEPIAKRAPPIYTPITHTEFVEKKIRDERLPPGYLRVTGKRYLLRPEAIESVFYMYRITGDVYWRKVGWEMFTAVQQHTKALYGHSAVDDVTREAPEQVDEQESFWLAETLKYFYLLYDDPQTWSLDEWVLNTEAHFFQRPEFEFEKSSSLAP